MRLKKEVVQAREALATDLFRQGLNADQVQSKLVAYDGMKMFWPRLLELEKLAKNGGFNLPEKKIEFMPVKLNSELKLAPELKKEDKPIKAVIAPVVVKAEAKPTVEKPKSIVTPKSIVYHFQNSPKDCSHPSGVYRGNGIYFCLHCGARITHESKTYQASA